MDGGEWGDINIISLHIGIKELLGKLFICFSACKIDRECFSHSTVGEKCSMVRVR